MDPTSLKLFQGLLWSCCKGYECMAGQEGHGAHEAHMVVDTRARKWADLLRGCNRRRTPQQRKIATKCYANISSAVIEYERRYGCIVLRKLNPALIRGHKRG